MISSSSWKDTTKIDKPQQLPWRSCAARKQRLNSIYHLGMRLGGGNWIFHSIHQYSAEGARFETQIFFGSIALKCLRVSWTRFVRVFRRECFSFPLALGKFSSLRMESRSVVVRRKGNLFPIAPLSLPLSFLVAVLSHRVCHRIFFTLRAMRVLVRKKAQAWSSGTRRTA